MGRANKPTPTAAILAGQNNYIGRNFWSLLRATNPAEYNLVSIKKIAHPTGGEDINTCFTNGAAIYRECRLVSAKSLWGAAVLPTN